LTNIIFLSQNPSIEKEMKELVNVKKEYQKYKNQTENYITQNYIETEAE